MQPRNATAQLSGGILFPQIGFPSVRARISPACAGTSAICRRTAPMDAGIAPRHAATVPAHARLLQICARTLPTRAGVSRIYAGRVQMCAGIIPSWQKPSKTLVFHNFGGARLLTSRRFLTRQVRLARTLAPPAFFLTFNLEPETLN